MNQNTVVKRIVKGLSTKNFGKARSDIMQRKTKLTYMPFRMQIDVKVMLAS